MANKGQFDHGLYFKKVIVNKLYEGSLADRNATAARPMAIGQYGSVTAEWRLRVSIQFYLYGYG